jgi:rod shape-determining protein MreD
VRVFWTVAGIVLALAVQSVLSTLFPAQAYLLDPFLIVLVYTALTHGEAAGMIVGTVAGWVQDVHFGGEVVGLSGFSKLLVGFGVGIASTRFHLADPAARVLVLFTASVIDAILFSQLAVMFEVQILPLSALGTVSRAALNAGVGLAVFELMERRFGRERRAAR